MNNRKAFLNATGNFRGVNDGYRRQVRRNDYPGLWEIRFRGLTIGGRPGFRHGVILSQVGGVQGIVGDVLIRNRSE